MPNQFPKRNYEKRQRRTRDEDGKVRVSPRVEEGLKLRAEQRSARLKERALSEPAASTAWEQQAAWYDTLHGEHGDDFHSRLILPAVMDQLAASPGQKILDVCCGQGVLGRVASAAGLYVTGIDASPSLIEAATKRASNKERYQVGDARRLGVLFKGHEFDHAAIVLALQDIDHIDSVFGGLFRVLRPGGRVVIVLTHPCFRIPKRTMWGFDENMGVQYRRIEGYMTPLSLPIRTHPGQENDTSSTTSFHRPLNAYLNIMGKSGFGVIGCAELCSHRRGSRGPKFGAEDRAAKEFPVFLVLTAVRLDKAPKTRRTDTPDEAH